MPQLADRKSLDRQDCGATEESDVILLFDGVCNFCNGTVRFLLLRDQKKRFKFAPLQSRIAQRILEKHNLSPDALESIVLIDRDHCYTKSTAVLRIVKELSGLWTLLHALVVVPRFLRDLFYDAFAKRRYGWFGKSDVCFIPTTEERERFLE